MNTKASKSIWRLLYAIVFRFLFSIFALLAAAYLLFSWFVTLGDIGVLPAVIMCSGYIVFVGSPPPIGKLKRKIKQSKAGKKILIILYILLAVSILYAAVVSTVMAATAHISPKEELSTVVVLGCKVNGTSPSKSLYRRLLAAEEYLKSNPQVSCVVSGGKGYNEGISEAQCMYNFLTENGIDENRIFMEERSTSTDENLRFSMQVIKDNNLPSTITIVTDGYHQLRANIISDKNGINRNGAVSSNTPIEIMLTYWVREWVAIPVEIIK